MLCPTMVFLLCTVDAHTCTDNRTSSRFKEGIFWYAEQKNTGSLVALSRPARHELTSGSLAFMRLCGRLTSSFYFFGRMRLFGSFFGGFHAEAYFSWSLLNISGICNTRRGVSKAGTY